MIVNNNEGLVISLSFEQLTQEIAMINEKLKKIAGFMTTVSETRRLIENLHENFKTMKNQINSTLEEIEDQIEKIKQNMEEMQTIAPQTSSSASSQSASAPVSTPTPAPEPEPKPQPVKVPEPTPEPVRAPEPEPVATPEPVSVPEPEPIASPFGGADIESGMGDAEALLESALASGEKTMDALFGGSSASESAEAKIEIPTTSTEKEPAELLEELKQEKENIKTALTDLRFDYMRGLIDEENYKVKESELEGKLASIEKRIQELTG